MVVEWPIVRVEDIAEKIAMGPFGSNIKVETFVETGVPVISGAHLRGVRLEDGGFNFVTAEHAERMKNSNVFRGDVIFTHAGNIGQVAYIPPTSQYERYVISQRQFYLRCDTKKADPEFLSYYFHSREGQHKLLANASQTGVPSIARPSSYLKTIELALPSLSEQRAIAHMLGTLDDRIELNRRHNQTLEAMARALFQDWFVDFGPVRAKVEGHEPYLPADLWQLFPNCLDGEGKPEGWNVKFLTEVFDFKEGPGIRNWQYTNTDEGTRFINIRCIKDGDLFVETANRITDEEANGKYAHFHLQPWDVVVSTSGTLGRSAIVRREHLPLVLNTSVIRFRPVATKMHFCFLYQYLNSEGFLVTLNAMASGSVQKNFGPVHLKQMKLIYPAMELISRYEEICRPLLERIVEAKSEIDRLARLRDTLLSKLVTGELHIKDVAKFKESEN